MRAARAKVSHLSGGECVDTVFKEIEGMQVLAANGSSAEALSYPLIRKVEVQTLRFSAFLKAI